MVQDCIAHGDAPRQFVVRDHSIPIKLINDRAAVEPTVNNLALRRAASNATPGSDSESRIEIRGKRARRVNAESNTRGMLHIERIDDRRPHRLQAIQARVKTTGDSLEIYKSTMVKYGV